MPCTVHTQVSDPDNESFGRKELWVDGGTRGWERDESRSLHTNRLGLFREPTTGRRIYSLLHCRDLNVYGSVEVRRQWTWVQIRLHEMVFGTQSLLTLFTRLFLVLFTRRHSGRQNRSSVLKSFRSLWTRTL